MHPLGRLREWCINTKDQNGYHEGLINHRWNSRSFIKSNCWHARHFIVSDFGQLNHIQALYKTTKGRHAESISPSSMDVIQEMFTYLQGAFLLLLMSLNQRFSNQSSGGPHFFCLPIPSELRETKNVDRLGSVWTGFRNITLNPSSQITPW